MGVVVAMHLLLGWALVNGLARKVVEVIGLPLEARIIAEAPPAAAPEMRPVPPPQTTSPRVAPPPETTIAAPPVPAPSIAAAPIEAPAATAAPAPEASPAPALTLSTAPALDFKRCAKPEYHTAALRARAQGTTVVAYTMGVDGRISEARIEGSSGPTREHRLLDQLTLAAVKACTGRPGTIDGRPQPLSGRITYEWKLVD